jgi:hypothetical protein
MKEIKEEQDVLEYNVIKFNVVDLHLALQCV